MDDHLENGAHFKLSLPDCDTGGFPRDGWAVALEILRVVMNRYKPEEAGCFPIVSSPSITGKGIGFFVTWCILEMVENKLSHFLKPWLCSYCWKDHVPLLKL